MIASINNAYIIKWSRAVVGTHVFRKKIRKSCSLMVQSKKFSPRYSCQDDFPSNSYLLFQNLKHLVLNLLGIQLRMSSFSAVDAQSND